MKKIMVDPVIFVPTWFSTVYFVTIVLIRIFN